MKVFQKRLKQNLVPSSLILKYLFKKSELLKDKQKVLDFLIKRQVLYQLAKQEKLPDISEEKLKQALDKLKGKSSHKAFSKKLSKVGLTLDALKKDLLIDLKADFLLKQAVLSNIVISEQDIESYHFAKYNQALFKTFEYEFVSVSFSENQKDLVLKKRKREKRRGS